MLHEIAPDSIGDRMAFRLTESHPDKGAYTLQCETKEWMKNGAGTLHGGMGAAILDQAMGFIAWCVKPGPGQAPTIQLQTSYHRPLLPGKNVTIRIRVISVTHHLIHLSAEAAQAESPEKICLTGNGTYFYKPD